MADKQKHTLKSSIFNITTFRRSTAAYIGEAATLGIRGSEVSQSADEARRRDGKVEKSFLRRPSALVDRKLVYKKHPQAPGSYLREQQLHLGRQRPEETEESIKARAGLDVTFIKRLI